MPMIMPTEIGQVTDQSQPAGKNLLDVLSNQALHNPWEEVRKILDSNYDRYIQAQEQEALNNTIDAFYRRREAGQDPTEAIKGLEARITGSEDFQNRADKIRSSLIDQSVEEREQAKEADRIFRLNRQDQANTLFAEFQRYINQYGPESAPIWWRDNKARVEANPDAYKLIAGALNGEVNLLGNYSSANVDSVQSEAQSLLTDIAKAQESKRRFDNTLAFYGLTSKDLTTSPEENFQSWLSQTIKDRGYEGESADEFSNYINGIYRRLLDTANNENLNMYLIPGLIRRGLENALLSYVPFRSDPSKTDISMLEKQLREYTPGANNLATMSSILTPLWANLEANSSAPSSAISAMKKAVNDSILMEKIGELSPEDIQEIMTARAAKETRNLASLGTTLRQIENYMEYLPQTKPQAKDK